MLSEFFRGSGVLIDLLVELREVLFGGSFGCSEFLLCRFFFGSEFLEAGFRLGFLRVAGGDFLLYCGELFLGLGFSGLARFEAGVELFELVVGIGQLLVSGCVLLSELFSSLRVLIDLLVELRDLLLGGSLVGSKFLICRFFGSSEPFKARLRLSLLSGLCGNFLLQPGELCRCLGILLLCVGELFFRLGIGDPACC